MWHSPNAGHTPDVKFLRAAGIILVVLALGAGTVSLIGVTTAGNGPPVEITRANMLEQGATAIFQAVDSDIARRHELSPEFISQEGDTR
jgi:hypothetical protein